MIVLGIDPGSIRIGYGAIEKQNGNFIHYKSGLLNLPPTAKTEKLAVLEKELIKLLKGVRPDLAGIEKLYFAKNRKTGLEVAQARGVIIAALTKNKIPILEMAPSQVKLAVAGRGNADKKEVAKMVALSLNLPAARRIDDITDALAVAIAALTLNKF